MAVPLPPQTFIVTDTDPALQRDYGNTLQDTLSPLSGNSVIYVTTNTFLNNFTNILGGASAGNNGEIQFSEGGGFAASGNLVYDPITYSLTIGGRIAAGSVSTDLLYYSNGQPWSFTTTNTAAGGNTTELQYNNAGNTAGIPSVRYFSGNGVLSLGTVANVKITGGSASQYLRTDGAGNLSFASITPTAAGSNTQIQFNNSSVTTGAANFTYNFNTEIVSANGLNVTNLATANNITVTSNVSAGNLSISGRANITGNLISGNLTTTNLVATTVNVSGNITTSSYVKASDANITGNAAIGNINTAAITATGNIAFSGANVSLGSVTNLKITGGLANRILATDGSGNLRWAVPATAPGGTNTQIQFNDAGVLSGTANLTYNKFTDTFSTSNVLFTGSNITLGDAIDVHMFGGATSPAALGQPVVSGGVIQSIPVSTPGFGYDYPPVVTINSSFITPANVIAVLDDATGSVLNIEIVDGGTGYSNAATANIASPGVKFLSTDGEGNLSFRETSSSTTQSGGGTGPSGPSTSVQFNDAGVLAGSSSFTFTKSTNTLSVSNNITAANTVTAANLNVTNIVNLSGPNVSLGAVGNLHITGGTNGQVLTTNGSGNLSFVTIDRSLVSNGNSNVTVALDGNISINANAASNKQWIFGTNGTVTFPGNILQSPANTTFEIKTTNGNAYTSFYAAANNYTSIGIQDDTTGNNPGWGYVGVNMSNVNTPTAFIILEPADTGSQVGWGFDALGHFSIPANGTIDFLNNNGSAIKQVSLRASSDANFTANYTLTLPVNDGTSGQFLATDGSGILSWNTVSLSNISNGNSNVRVAANSNVTITSAGQSWTFDTSGNIVLPTNTANINYANGSPFIVIPTQIVNGNSNVTILANGSINTSANGTANIVQVVSSGDGNLQTTGIIANGFIRANSVTSNNFIFGNATTTVSNMRWLGTTTNSTLDDQILYTSPSANVTSIDFHVTATGVTGSGNSRQVAKLLAVTIDSMTNFTEYGGMFIGANLGDFSVIQSGSNVALVVTPTTANTVQYNVILTTYF